MEGVGSGLLCRSCGDVARTAGDGHTARGNSGTLTARRIATPCG